MLSRGARYLPVLGALLLPWGCSSSHDEAPAAAWTPGELDDIGAKASAQSENPGSHEFTVPSSLAGSVAWVGFVAEGAGITVIGTNDAGERQAVLAWVADPKGRDALACWTPAASADACSAALTALKRDMTPDSNLATATLRPLQNESSTCKQKVIINDGAPKSWIEGIFWTAPPDYVESGTVSDCACPEIKPGSNVLVRPGCTGPLIREPYPALDDPNWPAENTDDIHQCKLECSLRQDECKRLKREKAGGPLKDCNSTQRDCILGCNTAF